MLIIYNDNYKDILMRYYQSHFDGKFPTYSSVNTEEISQGEDKAKRKVYTESVKDIYGHDIAFGSLPPLPPHAHLENCQYWKVFGNLDLKNNSPNNRHIIATIYYKYYYSISNLSVFLPQSGNCWFKVCALGCQYWKVFGNLDLKNNSPNNRRIIAKLFIK